MKIDAIVRKLSSQPAWALDPLQQMVEESNLPLDIVPSSPASHASQSRHVLLTGATGFLGAFLLRELLQETDARVCCLTRNATTGQRRIRENLELYGIWESAFAQRIDVVEGNLEQPGAGMDLSVFQSLAGSLDAIYHCAASVNWIYPYRRLAGANVRGTRELLRLACAGRSTAFHFVSSSAVCYSTTGPRYVDEHTEMHAYLDGIHLGYAQTKCVAESLVRQAGERGLATSIYRPALICGDTGSGRSNQDDFLARFIKGCIEMGSAPELDWSMDCCPVDFAAMSIVKLARQSHREPVSHLMNPHRRHWHECILWINLFGYPVRLIPFREWIAELRKSVLRPNHPLRELAPFFCRPVPNEPSAHLPNLYEENRGIRVSVDQSTRQLASMELSWPALSATLFDRYFQSFIETGFLPPVPTSSRIVERGGTPDLGCDRLSSILGTEVVNAVPVPGGSTHSIVTELTSWRFNRTAGLFPYQMQLAGGESLNAMVKLKPRDSDVLEVAESIAFLCSEELGKAYATFRQDMEFVRCDVREPAVYLQSDPRFREHAPRLYGVDGNALIVEYLSDVVLKDSAADISGWKEPCIRAALEGLASIHAVWFGRCDELRRDAQLGVTLVDPDISSMTAFWSPLADHARPYFCQWAGDDIGVIQERAISGLGEQTRVASQLTSTLIHNDFNPRNIALRAGGSNFRLCAYDWEMAKPGLPQHDLAEMLCFVLTDKVSESDVCVLLDLHRLALERAGGMRIEGEGWHLGFRISLQNLLINRLAMYTMVHRFRKQVFLPRVLQTWRHLYQMFS